jgi:dephospho-CoA kinase
MLSVGVTGNIGSGKSTVCNIFRELGIPIYEADSAVKRLYATHKGLKDAIIALLGQQAYDSSGVFDALWVRNRVFGDVNLRTKLNSLVHPIVFEDFATWVKQRALEGHPYVIKEAAILFESGADKTVDLVVGVIAPLVIRQQRVMDRDGLTEAEFKQRTQAQWPQEQWENKCAFVVVNDGEMSLIHQVKKIHKQLLARS